MILFCAELGIMISNYKGLPGSRELRAFAKKAHIDKAMLRNEGHPTEEHFLVPVAKHSGMAGRACKVVSPAELREARLNRIEEVYEHLEVEDSGKRSIYQQDGRFGAESREKRRQISEKRRYKAVNEAEALGF